MLPHDSQIERVQGVMLSAAGPEAKGEALKFPLIHHVEHFGGRALDDFVLQRRDTDGPLPSVGLGNVVAPDRTGPVAAVAELSAERLQVLFEVASVGLPALPVDAGCAARVQLEISLPQPVHVADVVP